jgi:hypothetical protein
MRTINSNLPPKLKALAIYQIVGGAIGLLSFIKLFNTGSPFSLILLVLILAASALFLYSIFCGIQLFKNPLFGLKLSKINQLLQAVHFAIGGYAFQYVSGVHISFGIDLTESFIVKSEISLSTWKINLFSGDPDIIIAVNVVALFLIAFIDKMATQLKATEAESQLADLVPQEDVPTKTSSL